MCPFCSSTQRRTVKRGEALFHAGEAFVALFAVRTGFFKTVVSAADGREQGRERGEGHRQRADHPIDEHVVFHLLRHRLQRFDGQIRIEPGDHPGNLE